MSALLWQLDFVLQIRILVAFNGLGEAKAPYLLQCSCSWRLNAKLVLCHITKLLPPAQRFMAERIESAQALSGTAFMHYTEHAFGCGLRKFNAVLHVILLQVKLDLII